MSKNSSGGWEKCWEAGATPWDLGGPTPIIVHLAETGSLPNGRALVPGCGTGYDVVAMACPNRFVVGLDVSKTVVERSSKVPLGLESINGVWRKILEQELCPKIKENIVAIRSV